MWERAFERCSFYRWFSWWWCCSSPGVLMQNNPQHKRLKSFFYTVIMFNVITDFTTLFKVPQRNKQTKNTAKISRAREHYLDYCTGIWASGQAFTGNLQGRVLWVVMGWLSRKTIGKGRGKRSSAKGLLRGVESSHYRSVMTIRLHTDVKPGLKRQNSPHYLNGKSLPVSFFMYRARESIYCLIVDFPLRC